jgi:hypothetical protein
VCPVRDGCQYDAGTGRLRSSAAAVIQSLARARNGRFAVAPLRPRGKLTRAVSTDTSASLILFAPSDSRSAESEESNA